MTIKDEEKLFIERFFEDEEDFREMFETAFENNNMKSPLAAFANSGKQSQNIVGEFFDAVKDEPVNICFEFRKPQELDARNAESITARTTIDGKTFHLLGESDEHGIFTFSLCSVTE